MTTNEPSVAAGAVQVEQSDLAALTPTEWAAHAALVASVLAEEGVDGADAGSATRELVLVDDACRSWRYDGARWEQYDGTRWVEGAPTGSMWLQPFTLDYPIPPPEELPADDAQALVAAHGPVAPPPGEKVYRAARGAWYRMTGLVGRRR